MWRHVWGCLRWPAGANFPLLYMGTWPTFRRLLLRVQGKYRAALTPIQSSSFDHFNGGRSNSVRLCLTLDRAVGYHQVHEGLLLASGAVELVKTSKMYIYHSLAKKGPLTKERPPPTLTQFLVIGQRFLEWAPTLERASCGVWETRPRAMRILDEYLR